MLDCLLSDILIGVQGLSIQGAELRLGYATVFLVCTFINKRARLLQSLVFFSFFRTDTKRRTLINLTFSVQYDQLQETKRISGKRI